MLPCFEDYSHISRNVPQVRCRRRGHEIRTEGSEHYVSGADKLAF
jgi:hypothetical protein